MIPQQIDIPGYQNKYAIRIDGTVINKKTGKKLKSQFRHNNNVPILYVSIYDGGKQKNVAIKTLMKITYFYPYTGMLICKNGLTQDCAFWNLEKITRGELRKRTNFRRAVVRVAKDGKVDFYESVKQAAQENFVGHSTMSDWCRGKKQIVVSDAKFYYEEDFYERGLHKKYLK